MIDLIEQTKRHEGYRAKAYKDSVGIWSIGFGTNLQELVIGELQAEQWLKSGLKDAEIDLLRNYPLVQTLTANRQKCLINMTYNMGIKRLGSFKKMWAGIEDGDIDEVCEQMKDSLWYKQVGSRADELIEQMRKG